MSQGRMTEATMSGDLELGRLIDPPDYMIEITSDDMAGILNIVEEALMRTDDFIDMDYGRYLREETREALSLRRDDIRELLARLIEAQAKAERTAWIPRVGDRVRYLDGSGVPGTVFELYEDCPGLCHIRFDDNVIDCWHVRDLELIDRATG